MPAPAPRRKRLGYGKPPACIPSEGEDKNKSLISKPRELASTVQHDPEVLAIATCSPRIRSGTRRKIPEAREVGRSPERDTASSKVGHQHPLPVEDSGSRTTQSVAGKRGQDLTRRGPYYCYSILKERHPDVVSVEDRGLGTASQRDCLQDTATASSIVPRIAIAFGVPQVT